MNNNQGQNKNNMWVFTCENDTDIDDFISKPKKERDLEHYTIELNAYLLKEYLNSRDPLPPDLGRGFTYKQDSCTGWWGRGRGGGGGGREVGDGVPALRLKPLYQSGHVFSPICL